MHQRCLCFAVILLTAAFASGEDAIRFEKITVTEKFHSEAAGIADLNRDGKMDVVSGPFWYAGPDFDAGHQYAEPSEPVDPLKYSKFMGVFVEDLNKDGWPDILSIGFPGEDVSWFENPRGRDGSWTRHLALDKVDNESPTVDAQGKLWCIHHGRFGYAERDASDPATLWTFRAVTSANPAYQRFTHGLGVGDVNGDGRTDLIEKDGWWAQRSSNDLAWTKHPVNLGDGGAQMQVVDVNSDGRPDVITSLQAHGYGLAWFEQRLDGSFAKHLIMGASASESPSGVAFSQPHAVAIADVNGDGLIDIVTGKRFWAHGPNNDPEPNAPAVLYWFECKRTSNGSVEFIAHKIDDDSGVGTQVVTGDVNGDKLIDVIVGNKKGTFVFLQRR